MPGEQITADQIVIAAGGRVHLPDLPGLDQVQFHTSDTVMRLDELPRRMAIVGGGYVAAEFAHVFSALGTEVTQIQRGSRSCCATRTRTSPGGSPRSPRVSGTCVSTRQPTKVAQRDGSTVLSLSDGTELETDVLLIATGRVPNGDRLGLENTAISDRGRPGDRRRVPEHVGRGCLGARRRQQRLPAQARRQRRGAHDPVQPAPPRRHQGHRPPVRTERGVHLAPDRERRTHLAGGAGARDRAPGTSPRTTPTSPTDGPWKALRESISSSFLADPAGRHLLGAHIIGPQASVLIQTLVQGMSLGNSPKEMARGQYWIHPSLAEVVENALLKMVTE